MSLNQNFEELSNIPSLSETWSVTITIILVGFGVAIHPHNGTGCKGHEAKVNTRILEEKTIHFYIQSTIKIAINAKKKRQKNQWPEFFRKFVTALQKCVSSGPTVEADRGGALDSSWIHSATKVYGEYTRHHVEKSTICKREKFQQKCPEKMSDSLTTPSLSKLVANNTNPNIF